MPPTNLPTVPTLRSGISDLVNSLNKLRNNSTDPVEQLKLQRLLRVLFAMWEEVIAQEIDATTPTYAAALKSLTKADVAAKAALGDLKKVAAGIRAAVRAAKAVDKVIKLIGSIGL